MTTGLAVSETPAFETLKGVLDPLQITGQRLFVGLRRSGEIAVDMLKIPVHNFDAATRSATLQGPIETAHDQAASRPAAGIGSVHD